MPQRGWKPIDTTVATIIMTAIIVIAIVTIIRNKEVIITLQKGILVLISGIPVVIMLTIMVMHVDSKSRGPFLTLPGLSGGALLQNGMEARPGAWNTCISDYIIVI